MFVDDTRDAPKGFVLIRDPEQAMAFIRENIENINILSLDYDLGEHILLTGLDIVKYMIKNKLFPPKIYIHSMSLTGRIEMARLLEECKENTAEINIVEYKKLLKQVGI